MDWDCPSYNEALATQIRKNFGKVRPFAVSVSMGGCVGVCGGGDVTYSTIVPLVRLPSLPSCGHSVNLSSMPLPLSQITPEVAIKDITAPEMSGDNHLAYYDLTHMMIYVSFAASHTDGGNPNAYARQFTVFDANALFDVAPPTSFETDE